MSSIRGLDQIMAILMMHFNCTAIFTRIVILTRQHFYVVVVLYIDYFFFFMLVVSNACKFEFLRL